MSTRLLAEGWNDLVDELKQLENYFPMLGVTDERQELEDDVRELEDLIQAAGEPEDEHSMRALTFLQSELMRKRTILDLD